MEQITDKRASKHTSSELYSLVISSLIHILPCHSVMSYPAMSLSDVISCRLCQQIDGLLLKAIGLCQRNCGRLSEQQREVSVSTFSISHFFCSV